MNFQQNLRTLDRLDPVHDFKLSTKANEKVEPASLRSSDAYVDPVKRMREFYNRGFAQPGKTFNRATPPPQNRGGTLEQTALESTMRGSRSSAKESMSAAPPQKRPSPPRGSASHTRRSSAKNEAVAATASRGYVSPNMAAFMAAEAKRNQRRRKAGTPSVSSRQEASLSPAVASPPRSRSAPQSRAMSPRSPLSLNTSLRITPRKSTPGTRIPKPSPINQPPVLVSTSPAKGFVSARSPGGFNSRLPRRAYNSPSLDTQAKSAEAKRPVVAPAAAMWQMTSSPQAKASPRATVM